MGEPLIAVRDLTRTYHLGEVDVRALRGVSLDVSPASSSRSRALGSGKSTFMHLLGCLDRPTCGSSFNGHDVVVVEARARRRAQPGDRVRLPGVQPAAADHRARERRAATALRRRCRAAERHRGPTRRSSRSASATACTITRIRCRAGSSSVSPSLARS